MIQCWSFLRSKHQNQHQAEFAFAKWPTTTLAIRSRVRMRFHVSTRSKVTPIKK
uniref:Uncharacterized protein n=1 Tax=Hyaloperonospora arabidopsidis (strain Emoy2) TaxID=559515 RepID=M4BNX4_HYAAE